MSIIHVLGYFYKLEKKRRKIIKEEGEREYGHKRRNKAEKRMKRRRETFTIHPENSVKKILTKGHSINERLLAVMMYIISFYIILSTDIHSNSCR
jgi:hypothetical protein